MADGGVIRQITVLGDAPGGVSVRQAVTILINEAKLQLRTASGTTLAEQTADAAVELLPRTSTGEASDGSVGVGAAVLREREALGLGPDVSVLVREKLTASGEGLTGTVADGAVVLRNYAAEGIGTAPNSADGIAILQTRFSTGFNLADTTGSAAVRLLHLRVSGFGISGTVGDGQVTRPAVSVAGFGTPESTATGAVFRQLARVNGFGESTIAQTYRTWVANMANEALTEYTDFSFNSYAKFNGKQYAAGPGGLFELTGDTDNGNVITWAMRTGMMDDKKIELKNLHEVLMGIRFNGPIRVRVYTDEETFYDYTLNNFREGLLHQVRVPCGKGLRSRYFQLDISGMDGTMAELDSLLIPMLPVTRRIG